MPTRQGHKNGAVVGVVVASRDLTEIKLAEESLERGPGFLLPEFYTYYLPLVSNNYQ